MAVDVKYPIYVSVQKFIMAYWNFVLVSNSLERDWLKEKCQ